jgi:hypothetical protein
MIRNFLGLLCLLLCTQTASAAKDVQIVFAEGSNVIQIRSFEDISGTYKVVEALRDGHLIFKSDGFANDTAVVRWRRPKDQADGPDIILGGHTGGNHCCYEVMSFNFRNSEPLQLLEAETEEVDIQMDKNSLPYWSLPIDMFGFGERAAIHDIPVTWGNKAFTPDLQHLVGPLPDSKSLEEQEQKIKTELSAWNILHYPPEGSKDKGVAGETTQILLDLVMSGHASTAKALLLRAWPERISGAEIFWREFSTWLALCPPWSELEMGKALPEAAALQPDEAQLLRGK